MRVASGLARWVASLVLMAWLAPASSAMAHPIPFSYLDVHVGADKIAASLVAHMIDVAHELEVDPPDRLLNPDVARRYAQTLSELLGPRLSLVVGGRSPPCTA